MRYHIMYSSNKEGNRSVYIASSYRNEKGQARKNIYRKCGNEKMLLAADPLAIQKIKAEVEALNREAAATDLNQRMVLNKNIKDQLLKEAKDGLSLKGEKPALRGLGLVVLNRLWNELKLPYKLTYLKNGTNVQFDFAEVVRQLCLTRILSPWSKAKTKRLAPVTYLGARPQNLSDYYNCLDLLSDNKEAIIKYLNKKLLEQNPQRDTRVCLYDITTYAFESIRADSLREFGYSKDKKFNEVQVVMALAADKDGLPVSYKLYKGNQGESPTMIPFVEELKKTYGVEKLVIVADRGLNNTPNIHCLVELGHDYVFSSKIRSASEEIKAAALCPEGRISYAVVDDDGVEEENWYKEVTLETKVNYRYPEFAKEHDDPAEIERLEKILKPYETRAKNKRKKGTLKRRYIVTFSKKRFDKDRHDRQKFIDKAIGLVTRPSTFTAEMKKGGKGLVRVEIDKKSLSLDEEKIAEQEKFDGMHVVETSLDDPVEEILSIYKELWHIESNFRLLKSQLEARPVYVRTEQHIRGHFLCCYIALVISRLLEYKLKSNQTPISIEKIVESLNGLRTTRIKLERLPAVYATTGISEDVRSICKAVSMPVLEDYETSATLRRKLGLSGDLNSYFSIE